MDQCCHRFNIQGNFAVLPTLIIITFGNPETRASETHVLRVAPGLNVAKLDEVDELCDQVACGAVTLAGMINSRYFFVLFARQSLTRLFRRN
jgi:uncharacterized membrane protein YjjP (DUF1212 family)